MLLWNNGAGDRPPLRLRWWRCRWVSGGVCSQILRSGGRWCLEFFADLLSPAGRGGEGRRRLVWKLSFVLVLVVFFIGSRLSGRGGKGRGLLEVLLGQFVGLLRARHGDGVGRVLWSSCPRVCLSTCCRLLQRRHGALRYVGGFGVTPWPVQVCWSVVDRSVVDASSRWRWCWDLGEGRRCSFSVLDSVDVRRMALVLEAWWSSPAMASGWCGFVFSGDGVGGVVALGRVFPLSGCVLLYVLLSVLCIS